MKWERYIADFWYLLDTQDTSISKTWRIPKLSSNGTAWAFSSFLQIEKLILWELAQNNAGRLAAMALPYSAFCHTGPLSRCLESVKSMD